MTQPTSTLPSIRVLRLLGVLVASAACAKSREAVPADDSADAGDKSESGSDASGPAVREPVDVCPVEVDDPDCRAERSASAAPSCASRPVDLTPVGEALTDADLAAAQSEASTRLATCSFALGRHSDDADKEAINLFFNGEVVPFDGQATGQDGWGWLDPEQTSIELYGQPCEELKNNRETRLVVEFGCEPTIAI